MNRAPTRSLAFCFPILAGISALACTPALAGPVRIYVGGQLVQAEAETIEHVVTGQLLPVLKAIGVVLSSAPGEKVLAGRAPDGTHLRAAMGSNRLEVNGTPVSCGAAFGAKAGEVVGPVADVARAIGCSVRLDKAGGELRIAHRLRQVEAHAADEATWVYLRLSAPAQGELRHLGDPPRAYVDFHGFDWAGGSEALETGGAGGLRRVRWALFQESPPITRVVVDLEPGAEARLSQVADRLYVLAVRRTPHAPPDPGLDDLTGLHVVIDPAGGGADPGATGPNTVGKTVNLDLAVRLALRLMNARAMVTLTRDSDVTVSTEERIRLVSAVKADLMLTIRCGASESTEDRGVEVRCDGKASEGLAGALQQALAAIGAKSRGPSPSPGAGLPGIDVPCAVAIVGYLTCPDEERLLVSTNYQEQIAIGLARGIAAFAGRLKAIRHAAEREALGS